MNALEATCPPASVLSDFGLGKLDVASAETVIRHLETCADCRGRAANLPGDSFVDRLRDAGGASQEGFRRERTFVPGESLANAANSTDGSSVKEDGLPGPSRSIAGQNKRDGLASPSPMSGPPELADHPDYELIKQLGQGGMGTVYLARNREMDRPEVLKVVSKALLDRPGARERFQQEIRSAAKLAHPNIVAAYSVLRPGELLVFAMEYVRGQDLSQVVQQRGPLPVANAAFYIHQVAHGLQHAFEKGMVHRDIKPNNLMLAIEGKKHTVKILDFGLAKATSEKGADAGLTKSGQMLGTPDYVAPEQTLDAQNADIRADIYSLGCTLYFLLSGGPPFQENSLYAILEAHHKREPKPLNLVRAEVPAELAAVVAKMMAKDPARRYQTPIEVAKALVPFFKPGTIAPPAPEPPRVDAAPLPSACEPGQASVAAAPASPEPAAVLQPAPGPSQPDLLSLTIDTHRPDPRPRGRWSSLPPWQQKSLVAAAGAAAVVLLGVILLVRTPYGIVEIEVSDPKAKVTVAVDGKRIDVGGLDEPLSLEVGDHELTVIGQGFETITKRFKVTRGKNAPLTIALLPKNDLGVDDGVKNSAAPASPEEFVPLFNGKDLTGWTEPDQKGGWEVVDGALRNQFGGRIFTEKTFANFAFNFEFQMSPDACASIDLLSFPDDAPLWVFLDNTRNAMGAITWDGREKGFYVDRLDPPAEVKPDGQWNEMTIELRDSILKVTMNGRQLGEANIEEHMDRRRESLPSAQRQLGRLAINKRWGTGAVLLRNLSLKEFSAARVIPLRSEQSIAKGDADANDIGRFACEIPDGRGKWSIEGDELVQASRGPRIGLLFGDADWRDIDYSIEVQRTAGKESCELRFRFQDDANADHYFVGGWHNTRHGVVSFDQGNHKSLALVNGSLSIGTWYQVEVRLRGERGECFLDGNKIATFNARGGGRGRVGLLTCDSSFRFRNISVKSPDGKVLLAGLPDLANASIDPPQAAGDDAKPEAAAASLPRFACEIRDGTRGSWSIDGDQLVAKPTTPGGVMLFGDPNWTDYDFHFEAKVIRGWYLRTFFRFQHSGNFHSYNIGAWTNTWRLVDTMEHRKWGERQCQRPFSLAKGDWYQVHIQVRGEKGSCFLNGNSSGDFAMPNLAQGRVGFTLEERASYRFRNIVVKSPDGTVLLEGLPDLDGGDHVEP
ncbi:MAG TPA: family 16 glycoside hydrolase [Pirellulales bacterium]